MVVSGPAGEPGWLRWPVTVVTVDLTADTQAFVDGRPGQLPVLVIRTGGTGLRLWTPGRWVDEAQLAVAEALIAAIVAGRADLVARLDHPGPVAGG